MPEQHLRIVGQLHGIVGGVEQGKVLGNAKAGALLQPPDQAAAHDAQQGMQQEQSAPARDGPALSRHEGGTQARHLLPGDGLDASGNGLEFGLCRIPLQAQRFVLERRQGLGGLALVAHHAQAQVALQLQAVALRAHLQHQAFAAQAEIGRQLVIQLDQAQAAPLGGCLQRVMRCRNHQVLELARGGQGLDLGQRVQRVQRTELLHGDDGAQLLAPAPGLHGGHQGLHQAVVDMAVGQSQRPARLGLALQGHPGIDQVQGQLGAAFGRHMGQQLLHQRRQLFLGRGHQMQHDAGRMPGQRREQGQGLWLVIGLDAAGKALEARHAGLQCVKRHPAPLPLRHGQSTRHWHTQGQQPALDHAFGAQVQARAQQRLQQRRDPGIGVDQQDVAAGQLHRFLAPLQPGVGLEGSAYGLRIQPLHEARHRFAQRPRAAGRQQFAQQGQPGMQHGRVQLRQQRGQAHGGNLAQIVGLLGQHLVEQADEGLDPRFLQYAAQQMGQKLRVACRPDLLGDHRIEVVLGLPSFDPGDEGRGILPHQAVENGDEVVGRLMVRPAQQQVDQFQAPLGIGAQVPAQRDQARVFVDGLVVEPVGMAAVEVVPGRAALRVRNVAVPRHVDIADVGIERAAALGQLHQVLVVQAAQQQLPVGSVIPAAGLDVQLCGPVQQLHHPFAADARVPEPAEHVQDADFTVVVVAVRRRWTGQAGARHLLELGRKLGAVAWNVAVQAAVDPAPEGDGLPREGQPQVMVMGPGQIEVAQGADGVGIVVEGLAREGAHFVMPARAHAAGQHLDQFGGWQRGAQFLQRGLVGVF